jgi:cell division protein FtsL
MKSHRAIQEYIWNRQKVTLIYFTVISLISVILVVYIWQYMQMMEIQLSISELQKDTQALLEKIEVKQAERASLGRLERIEEIATRKLGMGLPAKEQMWYIAAPSQPAHAK